MAKAKADTKKKAEPKATKAIKKDKPAPKKAAAAKCLLHRFLIFHNLYKGFKGLNSKRRKVRIFLPSKINMSFKILKIPTII